MTWSRLKVVPVPSSSKGVWWKRSLTAKKEWQITENLFLFSLGLPNVPHLSSTEPRLLTTSWRRKSIPPKSMVRQTNGWQQKVGLSLYVLIFSTSTIFTFKKKFQQEETSCVYGSGCDQSLISRISQGHRHLTTIREEYPSKPFLQFYDRN